IRLGGTKSLRMKAQTVRSEPARLIDDPVDRTGQLETELELERSICSAILDTVPALIVVLDGASRIVRFNRSCEVSTGYLFAELEKKEIWSLFSSARDA